jgi:hypothetical protein
MTIRRWNRTVTIEINEKSHAVARIENTRDAARCLLEYWPRKTGYYYHRAILGCTRALRGELPDEDARLYLTDAARDAQLSCIVSLGPAVLDPFDSEIAAVCDQLVFEHDQSANAPSPHAPSRQ